jgi:SpoIID/LytB domain protein
MALAVVAATLFVATPGISGDAGASALKRITRLMVAGHGWGPGIGMGQWGDFGYAAKYHFTYQAILSHYYGTATLASLAVLQRAPNPNVAVAITENVSTTSNVGYDPVVTSPSSFSVASASTTPPTTTTIPTTTVPVATTVPTTTLAPTISTTLVAPTTLPPAVVTTLPVTTTTVTTPGTFIVPAGQAVDLVLEPNGLWNAYLGSSCTAAHANVGVEVPVAQGLVNPTVSPATTSPGSSQAILTLCRHDGVDEPLHGQIQALDHSGYARTVNLVPLQTYLDGVVPAEESASWGTFGGTVGAPQSEAWGFQALEAQAVAARSYTLAYAAAGGWNAYATICDSTQCQAYVGASYETPISNLAVSDTAGLVLASSGTASVISARYSASTGGWTAPGSFPAVRDRGDVCVVPGNALECNPNHTWQRVFSGAAIGKHFRSVGEVMRVRVLSRNGLGNYGGRVLSVLVVGTTGRVSVSGDAFAAALNLRSDWFAIASVTKRRI